MPATVVAGGGGVAVRCVSPPAGSEFFGFAAGDGGDVGLSVSFNGGRDYVRRPLRYLYYSPDALHVDSVSPDGGPTAGGVVVTVRGRNLLTAGGLLCAFGGAGTVAATAVDTDTLACVAPVLPPLREGTHTAVEPRSPSTATPPRRRRPPTLPTTRRTPPSPSHQSTRAPARRKVARR